MNELVLASRAAQGELCHRWLRYHVTHSAPILAIHLNQRAVMMPAWSLLAAPELEFYNGDGKVGVMTFVGFYPLAFQVEGVMSLPVYPPGRLAVHPSVRPSACLSALWLVTDLSRNHQMCTTPHMHPGILSVDMENGGHWPGNLTSLTQNSKKRNVALVYWSRPTKKCYTPQTWSC